MDASFLAELNERLFVQFAQGLWRAPLGQRLLPVLPFDGGRMGRIVCAEQRDIERALIGLGAGHADLSAMHAAWQDLQHTARALRTVEGFADSTHSTHALTLPGQGPLVLLSAAQTPIAVLAGLLLAGATRGVLWKPAPAAAASAHLLMRAMGPLAGGNLALLQGDHQTGAGLTGKGALIWASPLPVPEGLGDPVLSLAATAPRRR